MRTLNSIGFATSEQTNPTARRAAAAFWGLWVFWWASLGCAIPGPGSPPLSSADGGEQSGQSAEDAGVEDASHVEPDGGGGRVDGDGGPAMDVSSPPFTASAFQSFEWEGFTYWLYRPSNLSVDTSAPLVVMLHGCQQSAIEFKEDTELLALAETEKFWVVYPEQKLSHHPLRCWRWFDGAHQSRDEGEPAILRGIVGSIQERHNIDPERIYVAGISAGAAMTVILATIYSDVFRKAFALAGLPFQAARSEFEVAWAMGAGVLDPIEKGRVAYASMAPDAPMTQLFVMHGQSDLVVAPINGVQLVQQWSTCADLHWDGLENEDVSAAGPQTLPAGDENARDAVLQKHLLPSGKLIVASLWVDGLGHKWPGSLSENPYADAVGPSATQWMWDFFTDNMP